MLLAGQDSQAQFKSWWKSLPSYSKFLFISTVSTSILNPLLSLINFPFLLYFTFNPFFILHYFYLFQFLTFPLICNDPLSALLSLCVYMPICAKKERLLGTFRFILYFTLQNVLIGMSFIPLYYVFSMLGVPSDVYLMKLFLAGLWPAIMTEMIQICNQNGEEEVQFMCFPVKIKRKWYPWSLFLMFSLIFGVLFSLLAGIAIGYLCKKYLDLYGYMKWSDMSDEAAQIWEDRVCVCKGALGGFVRVSEAGQELPSENVASGRPDPPSFGVVGPSLVPFSGTGYRLGGNEPSSAPK